ncbi:MAG: hypothetical protein JWQ11_2086 [Rhizobacter sp.]|nr:hypothetical protein [Rhizobacter sp.]
MVGKNSACGGLRSTALPSRFLPQSTNHFPARHADGRTQCAYYFLPSLPKMSYSTGSPPLTWKQVRIWVFAFVIAMLITCSMVYSAAPPKNFAFTRASSLTGTYKAHATGFGWSFKSLVGNEVANCESSAYFISIQNRSTCPPGDEYNGQVVTAERVEIPSFFGPAYFVNSIKLASKPIYQLSDDEVRTRWMASSFCFTVFPAMMFANAVWLIAFCLRKLRAVRSAAA